VEGRRVPVVGNVSMDQITLDLGHEATEGVGAEVVLLGAAGDERITAEELARHRDSITYEVVCGFGPRLPRVHAG
jgi:alanine racemase